MQLLVSVQSGDIRLISGEMGYAVRRAIDDGRAFAKPSPGDERWTGLDRAVFAESYPLEVTPDTPVREVLERAARDAATRGIVDLDRPKRGRGKAGSTNYFASIAHGPPELWLTDSVTGKALPEDQTVADVGLDDGDAVVLCVGYVVHLLYCLMPAPEPEPMFETLQLASAGRTPEPDPRLWGALLYTDEDAALARYVRTHFDELNVLTGPNLRIFVIERPARWSAARRYWRAHLEPELLRTLGALRWLLWQPYDRSRSYEIARTLGVPPDALPALVLFGHATEGPRLVFPIESVDPKWMRRLFTAIQDAAAGLPERRPSDGVEAWHRDADYAESLHPWEPRFDPRRDDDQDPDGFDAKQIREVEEWYDEDAAVHRDIATLATLPSHAFDRVAAAHDRIVADLRSATDGASGPRFQGYNIVIHQGKSTVGDNFHFYGGQTTFINRPVDTVIRDFQNSYGAVQRHDQMAELLRLILSSGLGDEEKERAATTVHEIAADAAGPSADRHAARDRFLALRDIVSQASDIAVPALAIIDGLMQVFG